MTPVLYVKVIVDPVVGKSTLNIYKIELIGSRIAEIANGTFDGACWSVCVDTCVCARGWAWIMGNELGRGGRV